MASKELRPLSGRKREQSILDRLWSSNRSEFLAIYGRRRIGKTFLVRRTYKPKPVYFEVIGQYDGNKATHLELFAQAIRRAFYPGASVRTPSSWQGAFEQLKDAVESLKSRAQKKVFFFDELPWLASHRSGFLAALEHFWNSWCTRRDDILLVVCGSAASWMLRRLVNARGGLHNRLTQTIQLLPFTLSETMEYFSDRGLRLSERDVIELYMIFGGVPHYLDQVKRGLSVPQIVDQVCLAKTAPLKDEFSRLFASLFEDDKQYVDVVRVLARRRTGLNRNDLLKAVGLSSGGGASTILNNLEHGGFIITTIPFGRTHRDRIFRLTDEFLLFHLDWMARRRPKSWNHARRSPRGYAWLGLAFENVCLKHVDAIERALGISGVNTSVSAWQNRDAQIDLLIDRADDVVSVSEMKFTRAPFVITKKYAEVLRRKLSVFETSTKTKKAIHLVFVTSFGLEPNQYATELADQELTMDCLFRT